MADPTRDAATVGGQVPVTVEVRALDGKVRIALRTSIKGTTSIDLTPEVAIEFGEAVIARARVA
jgi:hypothetical protein